MRIILPWPPGGSTDIVGRLLAAELTARLKQQVIIDNRSGAGGIVGMQIAAAIAAGRLHAHDDFHRLRLPDRQAGNVPVDLINSFAPVAMIGVGDSALSVHPALAGEDGQRI